MRNLYIHPESHEIDTFARRQVPRVLPASREHRELTGRDYGIDMSIELFKSGHATGLYLLFQIKGTKSYIENNINELIFDLPVRTLKYSELFISPLLLVVCPVYIEPPVFYYLWLQEYIKTVLDYDNPNWRMNKVKARVKIPIENRMSGKENKLFFIANFPRRLFDWSQMGRILHEIRFAFSCLSNNSKLDRKALHEILELLQEIRDFPGIFNDPNWAWAQNLKKLCLEPGINAAKLLLRGGPYSEDDFNSLSLKIEENKRTEFSQEVSNVIIQSQLHSSLDQLSAGLAIGNDYRLKRTVWKTVGDHDF